MTIDQLASQDFERATTRAFWRKVVTRLTGANNELLPFDEVREKIWFRGQHYIGLHQVLISQIVGSMGRFNDFDRAFLPIQNRTRGRWISIDKAHYEDIHLPPVDLYKIGEIYFVKDGNHRVSVARGRGQEFIDAYVTQIDIPVLLTPETTLDELDLKGQQVEFLLETQLDRLRPKADVEASVLGVYPKLLEHIRTHRYYLGIHQNSEVTFNEAVVSWYDNVYLPVAAVIREHDLLRSFPGTNEADLYLWIMEFIGYLREAYQAAGEAGSDAAALAGGRLIEDYPHPAVRQLVQVASQSSWIREWILEQEREDFLKQTRFVELRPSADITTTLLGQYEILREHIAVHRWYLGEQRKDQVSYDEAVGSWFDHVYSPIIDLIREQEILKEFPGRTEADIYLWIIRHQWFLRENYGEDVPIGAAAEEFTRKYSSGKLDKFILNIKRLLGKL